MDFEKVCMMFTMQEPFYGILLSSMSRQPVPESICKTMAVGRSGNVFKLIYNKNFVDSLDIDTLLLALKHEVLHVAFNHFSIFETEPENQQEQEIRNYAADLEVNCYIDAKRMKGITPITVDAFGFPAKQGTRQYYRMLMDMANKMQNQLQQQKANAKNPQQPCNGGQGGQDEQDEQQQGQNQGNNNEETNNVSGNSNQGQDNQSNDDTSTKNNQGGNGQGRTYNKIPQEFIEEIELRGESFDDHSQWPEEMSDDEKTLLEQQVEDMLAFAADEIEKGHGTIPGEMVGKINLIRNKKKPKPVADWKRFVRRYLGNEFSEFIRKSKKRDSRRFPDAAGNRHRRKSHILVAIDTSGSVSMPEYQEFFSQISTLTSVATFRVVECDAVIQHEYDFRGKPNMTLHGGGGTSFEPVIDKYIKEQKNYDALIYFTDGYAYIPANTPKDTLWVVSSQGDQQNRKKYQVNGASVAFIPKTQK